ncbi:MAG: hypothetical protein JWO98_1230 [Frankiales bacterium]|nr:hypothetical protein [Frankiales bacterium]
MAQSTRTPPGQRDTAGSGVKITPSSSATATPAYR